MTYREQLNKVNELGINICDLTIAHELDCVLDAGAYTEEDFERLCDYAVYIYLKSEHLTANAIALCIGGMLSELGYTVEEITQMNKWKFIDEASYYM
jgi:hypothetical protein